MNKKFIGVFLLLILFSLVSLGFKGKDENNKLNKVSTNDNYKYIAINQVFMWVSNNGDGSHDPRTDGNGFYWPGGLNATKSAIFEDGLIFGGLIGREIRVNGNTHRQGLQAGKILPDGNPDNPGLGKYRIYKIRKGWEALPPGPLRDEYENDYNEWPVEDGAPWVDVDGDGIYTREMDGGVDQPHFIGDEVLWYVANDMDPARSTFTYGTTPMGLEFQTTVFGFNRTGPLGDMVFKKYKIINKGQNTIDSMIVAYWSDTDLGDANDDFTGCDTALSLGYTWNSTNNDGIYGSPPPAVGYDFFQGPIIPGEPTDSAKFDGKWRHGYKNLPMTAFTLYINGHAIYPDPQQGVPAGSEEFYNYMSGYSWDGTAFIDPTSGLPTKFTLTGDPVAGTGWYEGTGWPGGPAAYDRRHLMASGKFTMAPGDTQEVVVGILIAQGTSNLNSITALKQKDLAAQVAYDLDFQLTPPPPAPTISSVPQDLAVALWWDLNAESYDSGDPLIFEKGYDDTTFTFEGYRVWQFRDMSGTDPRLIAVYDLENDVKVIYDRQSVNGIDMDIPVINSPNQGLRRSINITRDAYANSSLRNGNPYYFAVTAYGYSPNSSPTYLENPPQIVEVIPGRAGIEVTKAFDYGVHIDMAQSSGNSDALVVMKVIDPFALTGHQYEVSFTGPDNNLRYHWVNLTTGDTLLKDQSGFIRLLVDDVTKEFYVPAEDTMGKPVIDGVMLLVQNLGKDSITVASALVRVKSIVETHGPGGAPLASPINVNAEPLAGDTWFPAYNSTGEWTIKQKGSPQRSLFFQNGITLGYNDYEIRFTGQSGYYLSGHGRFGLIPGGLILQSDTLAAGTVPFQIWNVGRSADASDDKRLVIKVLDEYRTTPSRVVFDNQYSQLPNGDWEEIFAIDASYPADQLPPVSGQNVAAAFKFGGLSIGGSLPAEGTVIRINTYKPITAGDKFVATATKADLTDKAAAKENIENISVFPNPYFGANSLERDKYQRFMRFTNLPNKVTVRIFSISGVFIQKLEKDDTGQYLDWDLRNKDGLPVASGMYIAYLEMPEIGTKIMKLAVIMETQYIDRL